MDAPSDGDYWNHNTAYHAGWPLPPPNTTTTTVAATAFSPRGSRSVTATPARKCSTSLRSWLRRVLYYRYFLRWRGGSSTPSLSREFRLDFVGDIGSLGDRRLLPRLARLDVEDQVGDD